MRSLLHASSIVVVVTGSVLNAQIIKTPIATVSDPTTTPGPAPLNAKAVATSPTAIAVSWDAATGARAYTVNRTRTDDPNCCVANSGLITTPSWTDGSLESTKEYLFVVTALYFDGRVGSTELIAATPAVAMPSVRLPKDVELLGAAEGVLRYTPCGQKNSGGPGPATITALRGSPAGAVISFSPVFVSGVNYVVDRAPEANTSAWTLVGSTCGGPSPLEINSSSDVITVRDFAGGVTPGQRYIYRVTAVSSNGAAGWNTLHFTVPCRALRNATATVSGSTVTLKWTTGNECGIGVSMLPENYTITSDYGYTKNGSSLAYQSTVVYGVPLGAHKFTMVGNYRTGGLTMPVSVDVTIAY